MEMPEKLIDFLRLLAGEFTRRADDIEKAYRHLQEEQQEEDTEDLHFEIGCGVGFAQFELNVKIKAAIETLKDANTAITNTLKILTKEKKIKPDKVKEGNIETLKNIADLCAALALKMETERKIEGWPGPCVILDAAADHGHQEEEIFHQGSGA